MRLALALLALLICSPAHAWDLFRSRSSAVERGNEALAKGQHEEALKAFDEAARELPDDPALQLDRGLALMGLDKFGPAREAFRRAGAASAPKEVRGPALYDLGLAFMKEADLAAKAEDLDGAKKLLEESVDAFRGSLRARPNNPDAAWNLELAKRRLVDTEQKREKKKQEEEEKKKDQQKDQQDKDQNKDENKDQQNQSPDAGSPEGGDAGTPKQDQDEQGDQGKDQDQQDGGQAPQPEPEHGQDGGAPQQPEPQEQKPQPQQPQEANEQLPEHMKRALDALEAGEENLEKQRARQRARQRPRRIEKDW
jgi:tetratricopeptide (TPR) repeat protein